MPKSSPAGKQWSYEVLKRLHARRPLKRILDVGPGIGTYTAFRQKDQHWTAVEIWGPYVREYDLEGKYDKVVISDIRYFDWPQFLPLDLVIMGDVLEHMSKDNSIEVLTRALSFSRVVLVSIPIVHSAQEERYGNPFEIHVKPDWSHDECIESFPGICLWNQAPPVGVYVLSFSDEDRTCIDQIWAAALAEEQAPKA